MLTGDPELEVLHEERFGRSEFPIENGRPLITPIKHGRLQQIAEMLHLRKSQMEAHQIQSPTAESRTKQVPIAEAPRQPGEGSV